MSYNKLTAFAVKDTMDDANPLKVVRGKEFDDEFDAITTAMATQDSVIANLVTTPTGGIIMYAAAGTPQGFLPCDGSVRSRNTYTALFQAIGTTYGVGDGSTTFNVPNLSGRFPYGGSLGQVGGAADSVVPAHTHAATVTATVTDPGHSHQINATNEILAGGSYSTLRYQEGGNSTTANKTGITVTATSTIAPTGVSATNTNLPPFVGLAFIIKI